LKRKTNKKEHSHSEAETDTRKEKKNLKPCCSFWNLSGSGYWYYLVLKNLKFFKKRCSCESGFLGSYYYSNLWEYWYSASILLLLLLLKFTPSTFIFRYMPFKFYVGKRFNMTNQWSLNCNSVFHLSKFISLNFIFVSW